jgi:hypothetical protein
MWAVFFRWLYSPLGHWPLIFSFMILLQTVGFLGPAINSSQGLYLNTGQHKHRINTSQTSIHYMGFEPMIPASERAKTEHALDRMSAITRVEFITDRLQFVIRIGCWCDIIYCFECSCSKREKKRILCCESWICSRPQARVAAEMGPVERADPNKF